MDLSCFEHVQGEADMKIIIPGGTGHLGTLLARNFHQNGHEVIVLGRHEPAGLPWRWMGWDGRSIGPWADELNESDVVINLAGRSVDCRYTQPHRREILLSRTESVRVVGEAIAAAPYPPHVWLQASTATIYSHRFDAANDEQNGIIGGGEGAPGAWQFSIDVARAWESAFDAARTPRTRKVKLRSAIVMSLSGGAFPVYHFLARHLLGGHHGSGRQFVSWIHERDFIRAVQWLIDHRFTDGVVNLAAPNPLTNDDFLRILREACGASFGVPAPAWLLEIAAFFHRTETELLLKSRRVVPRRLLEAGFRFEIPTWEEAARELCARRAESYSRSVTITHRIHTPDEERGAPTW
jgi:uncharacterized protein